MTKRIYSSILVVLSLALLFVLKVYVSDYFFDAFFTLLACYAALEMSRMLAKTGRLNYIYVAVAFPLLTLAVNLVGIHYLAVTKDLYVLLYTILFEILLAVVVCACVFLFELCRKKSIKNEMSVRKITKTPYQKFIFRKVLNTAITFAYPTFMFMFFIFVNHFQALPLENLVSMTSNVGLFVLLTAFLIPILTDTFAMLTGSLIGGKKLCPKISPNKTISGAVGGVLWSVLLLACVYLIFGSIESFVPLMEILPIWEYLLIVLFGSCVAQCGDLFESIIKRRANVKDSGVFLPGHGGCLDRIDSHIFIAPFILFAFWIFLL